jgi:hypothetical protein
MKYETILFALLVITAFGSSTLNAVAPPPVPDVIFDFEVNSVTGGTLVLLNSGSGATNDFKGDRFDGQAAANFEIQGIAGVGTLGITATSLMGALNVTGEGLQDGSSGYGTAGEGTSFTFDKDITITLLDWVNFTTDDGDSVTLSSGATNIGTFSKGTVIGSTDFSDTNPSVMSIDVAADELFTITYAAGNFALGQMGFTVVPEPQNYALLAAISALGFVMLRRRTADYRKR